MLPFQQICRDNRLGTTTALNQFITDFIEKHETKAKQQNQDVQYSLLGFYSSAELR
jgi:hypothetical protein